MSTPLIATLISVSALIALTVLFMHERSRERRYMWRVRTYVDEHLDTSVRNVRDAIPSINHAFIRQCFHYVAHKALAALLFILRRFEYAVERIAHLNRRKARLNATREEGVVNAQDSHLEEISRFKKSAALTKEEKQRRRQEALEGD